jgi:hypothetical protein
LSQTVIHGKIESPWNTIELLGWPGRSARTSTVPLVGHSSSAKMRNSVVLPQPLGPTMTKKVPGAMSSERSSIAVNTPPLLANCLVRLAIRIFGAATAGMFSAISIITPVPIAFAGKGPAP